MLNIMIISPTSGLAGPDICVETLVKGLNKAKYNPVVVMPYGAQLKARMEEHNITCYEAKVDWWFSIGVTTNRLVERLINIGHRIDPLLNIVHQEHIDLIITNTTVTFDGAILAAEAKIPHLFIAHALFTNNIYTNISDRTKEYSYKLMGMLSQNIICCCEHLFQSLSEYVPNAIAVSNGVDVDHLSFYQRTLFPYGYKLDMLCAGHYNANKQQDFIIKALGILKRHRPDLIKYVHLTCMGEGEGNYKALLLKQIYNLGIESHVSLEQHHQDIDKQYYKYNVYVNSSVTENLPLSVMEAMATGMPVLGTDNKGIETLVENGKNGYICDGPEVMAKRMEDMLEDPKQIETMSVASRKRICADFTLNRYIEGMEEAFDSAVDDPDNLGQASKAMRELYEALTKRPAFNEAKKFKILTIYPDQAIATYAIAIQEPLEYIIKKQLCDIEYDAKDISQVSMDVLNDYDIVICVRFFHDAAHKLALAAKAMGKCFIWYIDDNYSTRTLSKPTAQQTTNAKLFERMFTDSFAVMVNNVKLQELGNKLGANIVLLPTYQLITKDAKPIKQPDTPIRFGFFGTLGRDDDFSCVYPAIKRIIDEYKDKVEVEFIGYKPPQLAAMANVKSFEFIFDYRAFRSFFASRGWDFALAPLKDTLFNQSKTNNKYREYSSFSIPAIFSKVGPYIASVHDGENGLLVDNKTEEWYKAIKRMIENQDLRESIGKKAYEDIVTNYSIRQYAAKMLGFIKLTHRNSLLDSRSFIPNESVSTLNQRIVPYEYRCVSRKLRNHRRYWVTISNSVVNTFKIYLTSFTGQCDGTISIELFDHGRKIAESIPLEMSKVEYNVWTDFHLKKALCGYDMGVVELRYAIQYRNCHRLCTYEDTRKRTLLYKFFNKLHLDGAERNVMIVSES